VAAQRACAALAAAFEARKGDQERHSCGVDVLLGDSHAAAD
jgi:hypothetical protein